MRLTSPIPAILVHINQFRCQKKLLSFWHFSLHILNQLPHKEAAKVHIVTYFFVGQLLIGRPFLMTNSNHRIHRTSLKHGRHGLTESCLQLCLKLWYHFFRNMILTYISARRSPPQETKVPKLNILPFPLTYHSYSRFTRHKSGIINPLRTPFQLL